MQIVICSISIIRIKKRYLRKIKKKYNSPSVLYFIHKTNKKIITLSVVYIESLSCLVQSFL